MNHRARFMLDVDSEGFPMQYDTAPESTRVGNDEIEMSLTSSFDHGDRPWLTEKVEDYNEARKVFATAEQFAAQYKGLIAVGDKVKVGGKR